MNEVHNNTTHRHTMAEKTGKDKKGLINEEDIATLFQRYTATTVLALLQEVAQCEGVNIDWNALVKNTNTGISNAREYQMLWRHLAYRHALLEKLDDSAQPLNDDSDLECELEAFPSVTAEASNEATACVKVMIASALQSDPTHPNSSTVEAPLTINIPNSRSFKAMADNSQPDAMRGMNITVPVCVQKLPLPAVSSTATAAAEVFDANGTGSGTFPPRRKRKPWSEAEDMELIAAVQKFGEGNWAQIVRGEFKGDRTPSQLSQRWAIIRKRQANLNVGVNFSGSQLTEAQRAARHAMNLALDSRAKSTIASSSVKSQVISTKTSAKSSLSSDPVRAAAVAAGARIATQSDAASLLKAAQAKNAVHIMPTGGSSTKSSVSTSVPAHSETNPNVQAVSAGLATATPTTHQVASAACPGLVKACSPTPQTKASSPTTQVKASSPTLSVKASSTTTQSTPATALTSLPEQANLKISTKQDTITAEEIKVSGSVEVKNVQVQKDGACVSVKEMSEQVQQDKPALSNEEAELKCEVAIAESSNTSLKLTIDGSDLPDVANQVEGIQNSNDGKITRPPIKEAGNQSSVHVNGENQSDSAKQADLSSTVTSECCKMVEGTSKTEPTNGMVEGES